MPVDFQGRGISVITDTVTNLVVQPDRFFFVGPSISRGTAHRIRRKGDDGWVRAFNHGTGLYKIISTGSV